MDIWQTVFLNKVAAAGIFAWIISQLIKFFSAWFFHRNLDLTKLVVSGGMPSSHSALVTAACARTAVESGIQSPTFGLSIIFALVVMYDAAGVRQAVGRQARILNDLVKEVYSGKDVQPGRIRELLGHTPIEVFFGSVLGIIVALLI